MNGDFAVPTLFCCTLCGRDTTSKTRICSRCYGEEKHPRKRSEIMAGRRPRSVEEEQEALERGDDYHGSLERDDV